MADLEKWEARFATIVRAEMEKDVSDPAHDFDHFRRVWVLSQIIAKGEGWWDDLDHLALLGAAYFHDIVNPPKDSPLRSLASQSSANLTRELLAGDDIPVETMDRMAHAIEAHSFSAGIEPRSNEARVLQDADRLEALGAIGLARVFAVSGALGRGLFNSEDLLADHRPLDDTQYAVDHFEIKLLRIPERMNTKTGSALANERADVLRDYLRTLKAELEIEIPG